ncbi:MAG: hypothetical protein ACFCUE_05615 [Candidatus Bathyarchaeia archaeon]
MATLIQSVNSEPKHTSGHDTAAVAVNQNQFMCPECGKLFPLKEAVEAHLHGVHLEHLRREHSEFHGEDVVGHHVG